MKLTRSWLENYIDIPFSTDELCHHLTMAGLEVDEVLSIGKDHIIDIDLTPNRSDCLSLKGIARELNCINKQYKYKLDEKSIDINTTCEQKEFKLNITEKDICPRYGFMYLKNIRQSCVTPKYIVKRLEDIGINSIHPLVDILNYIMIDIGQPMHAYDADKIKGEVSVRFAKKNESFEALDGNEYKLAEDNIVVADSSGIISLAGIIGSNNCSVTEITENIIIESAFFEPNAIANKARKLKLQTESSQRFERGVDYNLPKEALLELQSIVFKNKICEFSDFNFLEYKDLLPKQKEVKIQFDKIRKVIGIDLKDENIEKLLLSLGCDYNKKTNIVVNPSHRFDLSIHADYIEEIARIYGYDNIPVTSERINIEPSKPYEPFHIINNIKKYMYDNGYSECINYSFVNDDSLENFNWKNEEFNVHHKIKNYMSAEQSKLRSNLAASLIKNIEFNNNMNSENSYRFYEISNVFSEKIEQVLTCVVNGN
ncbi:phenylalanine--tRNA ligase subunit beta, partial [Gammaproteobacteria bacterium]|nr:phenylalanine--tRNA ligase subunit beta [Gammaproteobacteria bacterium]